ncbi:MAG TPA: cytochrome d ubiquinol oxidase subunit II [Gammaproteobacteria bacterium]|nr:cytochrome d ubiquinol oxidase subunit II [Gammaproteobacteria bacterium]
MPDYETLQLVWWLLIAVLFTGFALTDGFDMGVGALLPFVGHSDSERRVLINAIAPHWDGNQVWFILAAGAIFAAWPPVYGTAFSLFYAPLMVALFALFLRPVGFDYRSKLEDPRWRAWWDWGLWVGSTLPPFIMGVAFGNLFLGLPFRVDELQRTVIDPSRLDLLHPFALLCGVLGLALVVVHGAAYAALRTDAALQRRLVNAARIAAALAALAFTGAGLWLGGLHGLRLENGVVVVLEGAWLGNYDRWPFMAALPVVALAGLALAAFGIARRPWLAFAGSSMAIVGVLFTGGLSLFPFVVPSTLAPAASLTVFNATSSRYTLLVMLGAVLVFVPLVLAYTLWAYRRLWGRVTTRLVEEQRHSLY